MKSVMSMLVCWRILAVLLAVVLIWPAAVVQADEPGDMPVVPVGEVLPEVLPIDNDPPADSISVTLITGDTVNVMTVDGIENLSVSPAHPEKLNQHFTVVENAESTYVFPSSVDLAKLDMELFNIDYLISEQYNEMSTLPVIIEYQQTLRPSAVRDLQGDIMTLGMEEPDVVSGISMMSSGLSYDRAPETFSALMKEREVEKVWLDRKVHMTLDTSVPATGAEDWKTQNGGYDGNGVIIAILDTGIDATHPTFGDRVKVQENFTDSPYVYDVQGHGTHCAGVAAGADATYTGMAPGADLWGIKVLGDTGSGWESWIIAGIEYAVDPDEDPLTDDGADVISMSLGSQTASIGDDPECQAIRAAIAAGVTVVISAGNSGSSSYTIGRPGLVKEAITVGALSEDFTGIADFSSRGPTLDYRIKPDLVAPGTQIMSSVPLGGNYDLNYGNGDADGWAPLNGTSMACPHVAGAAALLLGLVGGTVPGGLSRPEFVKAALVSSAEDMGLSYFDQGAGKLDLRAAWGGDTSPDVMISPANQYLGMLDVDLPSASANLKLVNGATDYDTITLTGTLKNLDSGTDYSSAVGFSINGFELSANAAEQIQLTVNLSALPSGTYAGAVSVALDGSSDNNVHAIFNFVKSALLTVQKYALSDTPDTPAVGHQVWVMNDTGSEIKTVTGITDATGTAVIPMGDLSGTVHILSNSYDWDTGMIIWTVEEGLSYPTETTVTLDENDTKLITFDENKPGQEYAQLIMRLAYYPADIDRTAFFTSTMWYPASWDCRISSIDTFDLFMAYQYYPEADFNSADPQVIDTDTWHNITYQYDTVSGPISNAPNYDNDSLTCRHTTYGVALEGEFAWWIQYACYVNGGYLWGYGNWFTMNAPCERDEWLSANPAGYYDRYENDPGDWRITTFFTGYDAGYMEYAIGEHPLASGIKSIVDSEAFWLRGNLYEDTYANAVKNNEVPYSGYCSVSIIGSSPFASGYFDDYLNAGWYHYNNIYELEATIEGTSPFPLADEMTTVLLFDTNRSHDGISPVLSVDVSGMDLYGRVAPGPVDVTVQANEVCNIYFNYTLYPDAWPTGVTQNGVSQHTFTTSSLPDGAYVGLQIKATDGEGNSTEITIPKAFMVYTDTTPPTVVSTIPIAGASGVPVDTTLQVNFSEAMNEDATVAACLLDPLIGGSFTWNSSSDTMTFTPSEPLAYDTTYTATIGTDARDAAGNQMVEAFQASFTTESEPFSVTTGNVFNINSSSAEVSGNLSLGPYASASVSFEYRAEGETEYSEGFVLSDWTETEFNDLLWDLKSGTTYYYRAKATAGGVTVYGEEKSFTTETFNSATISPTSADYNLLAPHDVSTTITWNEAESVTSVQNGSDTLSSVTDYELSDNGDGTALLTIRDDYLVGLSLEENETVQIDIVFNDGDPASFLITAVDPTPPNASIDTTSAIYDVYKPVNVSTNITWNRAHFIDFISDATGNLTLNVDYSITDNKTLKIIPSYLSSVLHEEGESVVLDIHFDVGDPAQLTITAIDTAPEDATIYPTKAYYDIHAGDNVTTEIAWGEDATLITEISDGSEDSLVYGSEFAYSGTTLTIFNSYLEPLLTDVGENVTLTISFDLGNPAVFTITAVDAPPVAVIGGPYSGDEGSPIGFDASGSHDNGTITSYEWDWDYNGSTFDSDATGVTAQHTWVDDGSYTVALRVTDDSDQTDIATATVTVANVAPSKPEISISPALPYTTDDLICVIDVGSTDPGTEDTILYYYYWYRDGDQLDGYPNYIIPSGLTEKGETWTCRVFAADGDGAVNPDYAEASVTILNSLPSTPVVDITPADPGADDNLTCTVTTPSTDADGDTITYTYEWYKDDVLQPAETSETTALSDTLDAALTARGDVWTCIVTPDDGAEDGASGQDTVIVGLPTVTTYDATEVDGESAILNMSYDFCGYGFGDVQFAYRESPEGTWQYTGWTSASGSDSFGFYLSGLNDATWYEFKGQLKYHGDIVIEGDVLEFEAGWDPKVTTGTYEEVTTSSAVLHGSLDRLGDYDQFTVYFEYDTSENGTFEDQTGTLTRGFGPFEIPLTDLQSNTTYYYRAVAEPYYGGSTPTVQILLAPKIYVGDIKSFTTAKEPPAVETYGYDMVMWESAVGLVRVTDFGDYDSVFVSIEYGTSTDDLSYETAVVEKDNTITISSLGLGPLEDDTTYYFRAKAVIDDITVYGEVLSFATLEDPPFVSTGDVTAIGFDSATFNMDYDLTTWGPDDVCFFYCASDGVIAIDTPREERTGSGSYSYDITGLESDTEYWVVAAIHAAGYELLGEKVYFTTAKVPPQVTTSGATSVTYAEAVLHGNLTEMGDYDPVTVKFGYGTTSGGPYTFTGTLNMTENTTFSMQITGLAASTPYYFVAIAQTDTGDVMGEVKSFTTLAAPQPPVGGGGGSSGGGGGSTDDKRYTNLSGSSDSYGVTWEEVIAYSVDLELELIIPEGTQVLNANGYPPYNITVTTVSTPEDAPDGTSFIGFIFDITPNGLTFDPYAILKIRYDEAALPEGVSEANLVIYTWNSQTGAWEALECTVDTENNVITAIITHLCKFTIAAGTAPAQMALTDLAVTPQAVDPGDTVTVGFTIANTGDLSGTYEAVLTVNGVERQRRTVQVAGKSAADASFVLTAGDGGTYTVTVGNRQASFTVTVPEPEPVPEPAAISVTGLTVNPAAVTVGAPVTLGTTVTNSGGMEGDYTIVLKINGVAEESRKVTLAAEAMEVVTFTITKNVAGAYTVECNGRSIEFTVNPSPTATTASTEVVGEVARIDDTPMQNDGSGPNWTLIGIIIAVVIVVGGGFFAYRRYRSFNR